MRTNKEILAVVNQMVSDGQITQEVVEKYFPELRVSKDERMMRIIMNALIKVPCSELDGLIPDTIRIWLEGKIKQCEQKPWNEEEENRINRLIAYFEDKESFTVEDDIVYANWLKSLKDRVQPQPKQEWNEEDINMIDWLIRCCEKEHKELCNDKYGHQDIVSDLKRDCRKKWDWLESLKNRVAPQKQWKPSKEQMEALLSEVEAWTKGCPKQVILESLYNDLKKLREG